MIRGIGDNLRQLKNVSTAHAQSLLHTRQATPPARVCCVMQPIHIMGASWANGTSLRIDIKCSQQLRCWLVPVAGLNISIPPPSSNMTGKGIIDSLAGARICSWTGRRVSVSGEDASVTLDFGDASSHTADIGFGILVVPEETSNTPLVIGEYSVNNPSEAFASGVSNEGAGDVEIGIGFGSGNSLRWRRGGERQLISHHSTTNGNSSDVHQHVNFQAMRYALYEIKSASPSSGVSMSGGDVLGDTYLHTGGSCHYKVLSVYGVSTTIPPSTPEVSTQTNSADPQLSYNEGSQRSPFAARQVGSENNADESCVVCLTDRKEVLLLPCRHCCVCSSCLPLIDKCPVCRATFNIYLVMQQPGVTVAI